MEGAMMHMITPTRLAPRGFEERGSLPVRLAATLGREFTHGDPSATGDGAEVLDRTLRDLTALYGAVYRPDLLDLDGLVPYKYMAGEVLGELGSLLGGIDLVVLAYATPEIDTRDFVGCFIADAVAGGPMVFSISDQGSTAPFTALRLAGDYLADCGGRRALVLALDQRTIPWDVPDREALPTCNAAVAVVVEPIENADAERGGGTHVWHYTAVAPEDLDAALEEALDSARRRLDRDFVLVAGRDTPLPQDSVAAEVLVAERGRVCTGVWHALDDYRLNHPDGTGPVVVVDYDPVWRYLGVAVFDGTR
jgi:hypothetical protein